MLQQKAPRKEPWESQNRPPQAAWPAITEPSVLTFSQGEDGAFHNTEMISFTVRQWAATAIQSRKWESDGKHFPTEALPDKATKEWIRIFVEWMVVDFEENWILFLESQIVWTVWITAVRKISAIWGEHWAGM